MIIDFHNHYYPPEFITAVRRGPSNFRVTDDAEGNPVLHSPGDYNVVVPGHRDIEYRTRVLDEAGVDMQDVKDALDTVRAESMREHIAQAVEDGAMSQDKADWLLEGLDKGFLDGPDFRLGRGFGGRPEKGVPPVQTE
jgi:hypothetical protein